MNKSWEIERKEIERKAFDLVTSYLHLRGQPADSRTTSTKTDISGNKMYLKIMQVLEEGDEEPFTNEHHSENHHERDFFGIKQENQSQMIKKIGFQQNQPLQKVMLSQFAQRPIEFNSSEELEKKLDFKDRAKEDTPLVKVEESNVKIEEEEIKYRLMQNRKIPLLLRKLPRISYLQNSQDSAIKNKEVNNEENNQNQSIELNFFKQKSEVIFGGQFSSHHSVKKCSRNNNRKIKKQKLRKIQKSHIINKPQKTNFRISIDTRGKGRKPENPEMEVQLIPWILKSIQSGIKLTQRDIRKKARELTTKITQKTKFTASKGWIEKFFRRHPDIEKRYSGQNKQKYRQRNSSKQDFTLQHINHLKSNSKLSQSMDINKEQTRKEKDIVVSQD